MIHTTFETPVTLAELLSALSRALDMVEGAPEGHAVRTAKLALRLGAELGLTPEEQNSLYFAALIKDSGCSNNAARIHAIFGGDELFNKGAVKFVDWSNQFESFKFALRHTEFGGSLGQKLRRMLANLGPPSKLMDEVTAARCNRGAQIGLRLGFSAATADAIATLDEHWDGKGSPRHLRGDDIPLLGQVLGLAQTLDMFVVAYGPGAGYDMLRGRSGRWFSPDLVRAASAFRRDEAFWAYVGDPERELEAPVAALAATESDIDTICDAFADIVDAKSSFTNEHSTRVTGYAVELGHTFGFEPDRLTNLRRAALLHDLGKLGIPNAILDKPSALDADEFARIKLHPRYTLDILAPIKGFGSIAYIAGAHHERLDGNGYFRGLSGDALNLDMRILATADVFDALAAARPYRGALPFEEVFAIMRKDAGRALDAECVEALAEPRLGTCQAA